MRPSFFSLFQWDIFNIFIKSIFYALFCNQSKKKNLTMSYLITCVSISIYYFYITSELNFNNFYNKLIIKITLYHNLVIYYLLKEIINN